MVKLGEEPAILFQGVTNSTHKLFNMWSPLLLCFSFLLALQQSLALHNQTYLTDMFPFQWQDPTRKIFTCQEGWEGRGSKCFKVFTLPVSWRDSQHICQSMGSTLVNIHDIIENIFVGNLVEKSDNETQQDTWWTGFRSMNWASSEFEWSDGTSASLNTITWHSGQPAEVQPQGVQCAYVSREDLFPWSLSNCGTKRAFICTTKKCLEGTMKCRNGRCISKSFICDGEDDCGDASDESSCSTANYCTKTLTIDEAGDITFPTQADKKIKAEYYCTLHLYGKEGGRIMVELHNISKNVNHVNFFCGGPSWSQASLIDTVINKMSHKDVHPKKYLCPDHRMIVQVAGNQPSDRDLIYLGWQMASEELVDEIKVTSTRTLLVSTFKDITNMFNLNGRWMLHTNRFRIMTIQIEELELVTGQELRIYNGPGSDDLLLAKFDSWNQAGNVGSPHVIFTTGHQAYVEFTSSKPRPGGSFKLYHRAGCEAEWNATYGVIRSPGYGLVPYPSAITCRLVIQPLQPDRALTIKFLEDFDVDARDIIRVGNSTHMQRITTVGENMTVMGHIEVYFRVMPRDNINNTGFLAMFSRGCETHTTSLDVEGVQPAGWDQTLQVSCQSGYYFPSAHANGRAVTMTCMKGGNWDRDMHRLQCQRTVCGAPTAIDYGFVINVTSVQTGGETHYDCFSGFIISSKVPAVCTSLGWASVPTCTGFSCSPLVAPNNGSITYVNGNGTTSGSIATFVCDDGFQLFGDGIIFCNSTAQWSGIPDPTCRPFKCLVPRIRNGELQNAAGGQNVEDKLVPVGRELRALCLPGFQETDTSAFCGSNKTLSRVPECTDIIECSINSGGCEQGCFNTIGNFTCSCGPGLKLAPDGLQCIVRSDLCAKSQCDDGCVINGRTYRCQCNAPGKELYTSIGQHGITPMGNDTGLLPWHIPAVNHSCVAVMCPPLVTNVTRLTTEPTSGYHYNDQVTFRCDLGYIFDNTSVLVYEVTLRCTETGTWDRSIPECIEVTCELPDVSTNPYLMPSIAGNETAFGSQLTYNCSVPGADPVLLVSVCEYDFSDHSYSMMGDLIICNEIDCGIPNIEKDKLAGINMSSFPLVGNTKFGDSFEFLCEGSTMQGQSASGNTNVTCDANGRWGYGNLSCLVQSCTDPGYPVGGFQGGLTSYEAGYDVQFKCHHAGYYSEPSVTKCILYNASFVMWNDTTTPVCKDLQEPIVQDCLGGVREINMLASQALTDVTSRAVITDNTGFKNITFDFNMLTALYSDRNVTWTATDFEGNTATCVWVVKVKALIPVTVQCPQAVTYDLPNYATNGVVDVEALLNATASDPSIEVTYTPSSIVLTQQIGNTAVAVDVEATDNRMNYTSRCRTVINFKVEPCGTWNLFGPVDGDQNCKILLDIATRKISGYECRPSCKQDGIFYGSQQPAVYSCTTGSSFSPSVTVPACVSPVKTAYVRTIALGYTSTVESVCHQTILRDMLFAKFVQVINHPTTGLLATCQSTFPLVNFTIALDLEIKTQSPTQVIATFKTLLDGDNFFALQYCGGLIIDDFTFITIPGAQSMAKTYLNSITWLSPMRCINLDQHYTANSISASFNDLTPNAPKGSPNYGAECPLSHSVQSTVGGGYVCVKCPAGHYMTNDICEPCQIGAYQNVSNQTSCIPCPTGTNTIATGALFESQCLATCPPGYISSNGLQPCSPCQIETIWVDPKTCGSCFFTPSEMLIGRTINPRIGSPDNSSCRLPCSAGMVSLTSLDPHCVSCPRGFYSGVSNDRTVCTACPVGKTTAAVGSTLSSHCISTCATVCQNAGICVLEYNRDTCQCNPGYTGSICEVMLDPCESSPCYNEGNCTALNGIDYNCTCPPTTNGTNCEEDTVNECQNTTCQNFGVCHDMVGSAQCICQTVNVYSGNFCTELRDICVGGSMCQNGGTCESISRIRYKCICPMEYTGRNCEVLIDHCSTNPCQHGAQCISEPGNFTCNCTAGFTGKTCMDKPPAPCSSMNCGNGQCVYDYRNNRGQCICNNGYILNENSTTCVAINRCDPNPCHDGACVHIGDTSFRCNCHLGYEGDQCQHDIDECAVNPCTNGSTCKDGIGNFSCLCPPRFEGELCDQMISLCNTTTPCDMARTETCEDLPDGFLCHCKADFWGIHCQKKIDKCALEPCLHGGICKDGMMNFTCQCAPGWEGQLCEHITGLCTQETCGNNAQCFNVSRQAYCICPTGLYGEDCINSTSTNCEDVNPCQNDGSCSIVMGRIHCNCSYGFEGQWCEWERDLCSQPSICNHRGKCRQHGLNYTCACHPGFTGFHCDVNMDDCAKMVCNNNGVAWDGVQSCRCHCPYGFIGTFCDTAIRNFKLAFSGQGQGIYDVFPLTNYYTFTMFVKFAKSGETGTPACLYGLRYMEEPLNTATEIFCMSEAGGINDGLEHFVVVTWSGGNTASITIGHTVDSLSVNTDPLFTHGVLVVGSRFSKTDHFEGTLRSVNFWNTLTDISVTGKNGDLGGYPAQHVVINLPSILSGYVRTVIGFEPAPSTKVMPTLLPDGCPSDTIVLSGRESGVIANIPQPKFKSSTIIGATTNYASDLPRQMGIYDVLTLAENVKGYETCSFNLYIRYGICRVEDSMNCTSDGPDGLNKGCTSQCPPGQAFIFPTSNLHTCGMLGMFSNAHSGMVFVNPPCGEKMVQPSRKAIITVQYIIPDEKEGVTSSPVLSILRSLMSKALTEANTLASANQGQPMCSGQCFPAITAFNPIDGLTTVTIKLTASLRVGPSQEWPLDQFLKQLILQDGIFDASPSSGKGLSMPSNAQGDISGKTGFSIEVHSLCTKPFQSVGIECVKCAAGTYYDVVDAVCKLCHLGQYSIQNGVEKCTPCARTKTTLTEGATRMSDCVDICSPGTRFSHYQDKCVPCGWGAYQPNAGQTICMNCEVGKTTSTTNAESVSDCTDKCVAGEYQTTKNTCELCRRGLFRRLIDRTCQQCPGGTTTVKKGATSHDYCVIQLCFPGQYNLYNKCVPCELDFYTVSRDATKCTPCSPGTATQNVGAVDCEIICEAGNFINVNISECEPCPPNTYKVDTRPDKFMVSCKTCPNGLRTYGGQKMLSADCKYPYCSMGEFGNPAFIAKPMKVGIIPCLQCDDKSYQPFDDPVNRTCLPCPLLSSTSMNGATSETECTSMNLTVVSATLLLQTILSRTMVRPSVDEYRTLLKKLQDTSSPNSLLATVKRMLGSKGDNIQKIDITGIVKLINIKGMPNGAFRAGFDVLFEETSFKGQTLSTKELKTTLIDLSNGKDSLAGFKVVPNAVTLVPKEKDCAPGERLNITSGMGVCQFCPVGTFQYTDIKDTCFPCDPGFTTSGPKLVWDIQKNPANIPCKKICPEGTFSPDNKGCERCPIGYFNNLKGIMPCSPCGAHMTTLVIGATSREQCIASCDPGHFSSVDKLTNQKACKACPIGFYSTARNSLKCQKCSNLFTTIKEGSHKKENCVDVCTAGNYCYHEATCRYERKSKKSYCDCKIPFSGDRCQIRGDPEQLSETNIIKFIVLGGFAGIAFLAFIIFGAFVLMKRAKERSDKQHGYAKPWAPKWGPTAYMGNYPVVDTGFGLQYCPMGISGDRHYPLIPELTSRSLNNYNFGQGTGYPLGYNYEEAPIPRPSSQFLFYEDADDTEFEYGGYDEGRSTLPIWRANDPLFPASSYYH